MEQNDWSKYEQLVLSELKRISRDVTDIYSHVDKLREEVAALKVKSGVWGLLGGTIPVIIAVVIEYFRH